MMRALLLVTTLLLSGCPEDPCVEDLDLACTPLSQDVSWSNVYTLVLADNCSSGGTSCHAAEGAQGGLVLDDPDVAYEQLVEPESGSARVLAGDPSCSMLVRRLELEDDAEAMPPGDQLSEAQRCMVRLWIDGGAQR